MDYSRHSGPLISVIVPVFNEEQSIGRLLQGLHSQLQPLDSFEVVLVDNGSTDGTLNLVREFNLQGKLNIRILHELKRSSYAARNRGVKEAGSVKYIVFIDADCVPKAEWLCNGIQAMERSNADLVGGHVCFEFSENPSAAEVVDSFTNLQMQHGIETGGFTRTANLFVKRTVFDRIGLFDPEVQSGEDIRWTKKATDSGLKLIFAKDAGVTHPARGWGPMIIKQFRVGIGKNAVLRVQGLNGSAALKKTLLSLWIPKWHKVKPRINHLPEAELRRRKMSILFALWALRFVTAFGQLCCFLRFSK
jgi:glycosyltransferase AglE